MRGSARNPKFDIRLSPNKAKKLKQIQKPAPAAAKEGRLGKPGAKLRVAGGAAAASDLVALDHLSAAAAAPATPDPVRLISQEIDELKANTLLPLTDTESFSRYMIWTSMPWLAKNTSPEPETSIKLAVSLVMAFFAKHGFQVNQTKTTVTGRHADGTALPPPGPGPHPAGTLESFNTVSPDTPIKYLGALITLTLNWKPQIQKMNTSVLLLVRHLDDYRTTTLQTTCMIKYVTGPRFEIAPASQVPIGSPYRSRASNGGRKRFRGH